MVTYRYDSWGLPLGIEDNRNADIAGKNPFRYRGYCYDEETGFYYLKSRYYDSEVGRFINIDGKLSGIGCDIRGYNLYSYCFNNPVNMLDPDGDWPNIANIVVNIAKNAAKEVIKYKRQHSKVVDLTDKLTNYMKECAAEFKQYIADNGKIRAIKYFYKMVTDGGVLDIKLQSEWEFEEGTIYLFRGKELRYDDPGNINYGYTGAVMFPRVILCMLAGANQVKKYRFSFGNILTWYDDPRDNAMIKYGYNLYVEGY